jgi:hypothetical protein
VNKAPATASAQALALALRDRMPEQTLMGSWPDRALAGVAAPVLPASGSDPKIKDPFVRYILTTFTYGTNLGPAQAARHIAGVTAHELATTSGRHVTIDKLNFYRPTAGSRFRHIDTLFGEPGRNVIDWDLIERHFDDLMRVVLSVAAGKISSVTLLRRLSTYSRRNNFYKAFREVGRVIRTIQLLRFLSDPQLRRRTTAATNKVEPYNNFSAWCRFGNEGRVRDNDPAEQEKQNKFSTLLANAVIFHTTLDMMAVLRQLAAEGWEIKPEDLAVLSPYHRRDQRHPGAVRRAPARHRPHLGPRALTSAARVTRKPAMR